MDVRQFSSDKILKHLDRVNSWLRGENPGPVTVELDMTNVCPHKCPHCFGFYGGRNKKSLSYTDAKRIIFQIKEMGGKGLTFTGGGEPLCNPATLRVVNYAKSLGLDIGFISNGLLINEQAVDSLVKSCTWVRISLDAASARMFKLTHGMNGRAFDDVVENIRLLVHRKKQVRSSCTIGAGYLTFPQTRDEIYEFALLCKNLGVDYAQFRPLLARFGRRGINYTGRMQGEIIKQIKRSLKLSKDGYEVLYSKHKYDCMANGDIIRSYGKCYGHYFATVICADQKIYLCCHTRGNKKYCIGDLKRDSLKAIWNSRRRKQVWDNIDFTDCVPLCRNNTFNQILWNIKQPRQHVNFL